MKHLVLVSRQEVAKLDDDELAVYKGRIAAMLRPRETIFTALRRLANMTQPQQHQQHAGPGMRSKKRGRGKADEWDSVQQAVSTGDAVEIDDEEDDGSGNIFTMLHQVCECCIGMSSR